MSVLKVLKFCYLEITYLFIFHVFWLIVIKLVYKYWMIMKNRSLIKLLIKAFLQKSAFTVFRFFGCLKKNYFCTEDVHQF